MGSILLLFAHPALEKSRVNRHLLQAVQSLDYVTVNDLYEQYPTFDIDVDREQELLLQHDYIILQHPFYWYSAPPLIKQWLDLVLEHGWAYGHQGNALAGKKMLNVITSGGRVESYSGTGRHQFGVRQFLLPFEQTARLCKMTYLPPFMVHDTHRVTSQQVESYALQYQTALSLLAQNLLDPEASSQATYLNDLLPKP